MKYLKKNLIILNIVSFLIIAFAPFSVKATSKVDTIISSMSNEEKISQMLLPSFQYDADSGQNVAITEINSNIENILKNHGFDDYVAQTDGVKSYLETVLKFTVSESKVDTYNGIKILSFEVSNGTEKGFYYLAQLNISSTTIMGVVENANATVDYSLLNKVAEVVKSATVEGRTFSTKVSKKIKLANLTMKKPN